MDACVLGLLPLNASGAPRRFGCYPTPLVQSSLSATVFVLPRLNELGTRRRLISSCCHSGSSEVDVTEPYSDGTNGAVKEVTSDRVLQVVLFSPQIPGNTGCIARTCAASAVSLHLIEPLGFQVDSAKLKRWIGLLAIHGSWAEFRNYFDQQVGEKRLLAFTKRGTQIHSEFSYKQGDWLVFGSETSGLPPEVIRDCNNEELGGGTIKIPMVETYVRCLNLAVTVGIAIYEASRQLNYDHFQATSEAAPGTLFTTEDIFA